MNRREFLAAGGAFAGTAMTASAAEAKAAQIGARSDTRFNVRDFGAKGDGRTPDSKAIQDAIDAAAAVKGTVWFPAGEYLCHDLKARPNITLAADPVWIFRGEKVGGVLQLDDPNAKCLLEVTGAFGLHVKGLLLNGIPETPKPVHGIHLDNPEKWSVKEDSLCIDETKVQHFSGHGIFLDRVWLFLLRHSHLYRNGGCGLCVRGWDGFVMDNQFSNNGSHGFGCLEVGASILFTANRIEWNHAYGLYILNGSMWNVTGNAFDRNWGAGLCVDRIFGPVSVTGNTFHRCGKDSSKLPEGEHSCQVRLDRAPGVSLVGNVFRVGKDDGNVGQRTPRYGFYLHKMSYSIISANVLTAGYMDEMVYDAGEHGKDLVIKDNVGHAYGQQ